MEELPAGRGETASQPSQPAEASDFESLINRITEALNQELHEIGLMLEQTRMEVNRLGQRSSSLLAYVKQLQERGEALDLGRACNEALDAQQRYLILKGQVEKLQQADENLRRFLSWLDDLRHSAVPALSAGEAGDVKQTSLAMLEMLVRAQEEERYRLARQMHDGPAQALSNFILQTEIAMRLFEVDAGKAKQELQAIKNSASKTFQQVREFIFDLRPMMLDDLGLFPTLHRYFEALSEQLGVGIEIKHVGEERRYPSYLEVFVFRTLQELVVTAVKRRSANHIHGTIEFEAHAIKARIEDDGTPIDENALEMEKWMNLRLLRDRVALIGGNLSISSNAEKETTLAFIEIPVIETTPAD